MWNYTKLRVVEETRSFVRCVYNATANFPTSERFGLASQIRRSAVSIGSNIVEGSARSSRADFARFLDTAVASAAECQFQLQLAVDLTLLDGPAANDLIRDVEKVRRMTIKLRQRVIDNIDPTINRGSSVPET